MHKIYKTQDCLTLIPYGGIIKLDSRILYTIKTDTQGCSAGPADTRLSLSIDISHSLIQKHKKLKCLHKHRPQ